MGTWADEFFGNDLACGVRDEYRDHLAAGHDSAAAVKRAKKAFADEMCEADAKRTVWIEHALWEWENAKWTVSAEQ